MIYVLILVVSGFNDGSNYVAPPRGFEGRQDCYTEGTIYEHEIKRTFPGDSIVIDWDCYMVYVRTQAK